MVQHHWGQAWKTESLTPLPSFDGFLLLLPCMLLAATPPCHDGPLSLWNYEPNYELQGGLSCNCVMWQKEPQVCQGGWVSLHLMKLPCRQGRPYFLAPLTLCQVWIRVLRTPTEVSRVYCPGQRIAPRNMVKNRENLGL